MENKSLRKAIGAIWSIWSMSIVFIRMIEYLAEGISLVDTVCNPDVWLTAIIGIIFIITTIVDHKIMQIVQICTALLCASIMLLTAITDQFGIVTLIVSIYVTISYGYYKDNYGLKLLGTIIFAFAMMLFISITQVKYDNDYSILLNHVLFWVLVFSTFMAGEIIRIRDVQNEISRKDKQIDFLKKVEAENREMNKAMIGLLSQLKYAIDNNVSVNNDVKEALDKAQRMVK